MSFNYQFPEDRVGVITALITGWEGRRQVGRTLCSRRQGSHRLLPDPLISYGDAHLLDMVLPGPGQA